MKKKIVILGAGISGLTLAWFLKKRFKEEIELIILEKKESPGGWIKTIRKEGFLFEAGPHSIRVDKEKPDTFLLLKDLNLEKEILIPNPNAKKQYVLVNQTLEPLPKTLWSLIFSRFRNPILKAICAGLKAKPSELEDESIASFSLRHFGKEATELLIDPMVSGIFAGKMEELSLSSCFPSWKKKDKKFSLLRSFFQFHKKRPLFPLPEALKHCKLFSFKEGMERLPFAIAEKLENEIKYSSHIEEMNFLPHKIHITYNQNKKIEADFVFSCLSPKDLALISPTQLKTSLSHFSETEVAVIHLGYRKKNLSPEGFGYLIPSCENEYILGMIWDSSLFPTQNSQEEETRITVIIGIKNRKKPFLLKEQEWIEIALDGTKRHLGIFFSPDCIHTSLAYIPQYTVHHQKRISQLNQLASSLSPHWKILGNGFYGVSINDCIANARKIAEQFPSLH